MGFHEILCNIAAYRMVLEVRVSSEMADEGLSVRSSNELKKFKPRTPWHGGYSCDGNK